MLDLLLVALLQETAGDLTIQRPAGWTRQDDAAKKTVTLFPPDLPPGVLCSVTVTPTEAVVIADWHGAVWNSLAPGGAVIAGAKAEAAGAFTRSWGEFRRADGVKVWVTLYTAVAQGKGRAVFYFSNHPDPYRQHAGAVDLMVRGGSFPGAPAPAVAAAPRFSDDAVAIPPPENWTMQPGERGTFVYIPPNLRAGQACSFVLYPSEASTADAAAFHEASIKNATGGLKSSKVLKTGEWGIFKGSDLEIETAQGGRGKAAVYTARWAGRGQVGVYTCNDDAVHTWAGGWIPIVLNQGYVPNPLLAAGAPYVPIVEVFYKAELEMGVTVDLRAGTAPRQTKMFLVLFKNGLAMRVDAMASGLIDTTYLSQGLASLDAEALLKATAPDRRRGAWEDKDGKLVLTWTVGTPVETYTREGSRLVGPKPWSKFSIADGVKLEGSFLHKSGFELPPWTLRLTKDGRFDGENLNAALGGRLVVPLLPATGGGTYEIRSGTLILSFDNGYRTSLALLLGGDPVRPTSLILNGSSFERR